MIISGEAEIPCPCALQKLQPCPVCQQWRAGDGGGSGLEAMDPSAPDRGRKPGSRRRAPLSEEHREKIRAAHAGRKRKPLDEEHKRCALHPCCFNPCITCGEDRSPSRQFLIHKAPEKCGIVLHWCARTLAEGETLFWAQVSARDK